MTTDDDKTPGAAPTAEQPLDTTEPGTPVEVFEDPTWDAYMEASHKELNKASPPMSDEEWEAGMRLMALGETQEEDPEPMTPEEQAHVDDTVKRFEAYEASLKGNQP